LFWIGVTAKVNSGQGPRNLDVTFLLASNGQPGERISQRKKACDGLASLSGEAPAGFEPAMADLQSAALATWPRRRRK
jgi:hypothetical protein